ncbi:hypothetical protein [Pseudogemmobacter humi]|uniref:Uncharacterized protein n=1 Tax=Pseudogemmobacter humi TaxID=2483812 RepID=A0A3P5WMJ6_9RHOB|nr:hypothetical protein [Pseudogemmobacter humi]VDC22928.1 hypothetical protein XINFAN_00870 [Pseudogemmobacter humi]
MQHNPGSPRIRMAVLACSTTVLLAGAQQVLASSGDAWEEFQQDVERACLAAASGVLSEITGIQVDPYGSETYGFAVVLGIETGTTSQRIVACAYDKASQVAEVSGTFEP